MLQYAITTPGSDEESILSGPMAPTGGPAPSRRRSRAKPPEANAVLPDLGLSLYRYPSDPELPAAARAMQVDEVAEAAAASTGRRLPLVSARVLAYRPGLRATIGYETTEGLALVGKATRPSRARRLKADADVLREIAGAPLRLLLPVATLPDWPLLLYDRVDGAPLCRLLEEGTALSHAAVLAARLADLHAARLPLQRERRAEDEAARIREHAETLIVLCPGHASRLHRLADRLERAILEAPAQAATIHGDLHDENVLIGADGIALIDLEEAATGDPAIDVARLLGALRKRALLEPQCRDAARSFSDAFVQAYRQARNLDLGLTTALEAGFLVKSALHCFETQRPDWTGDIDRLLTEAEKVAQSEHVEQEGR